MERNETRLRQDGFSLLEVTISLLVLGVLFGGALTLVFRSTISFDDQIRQFSIDQFGWRVMERLAEDLRGVDPDTLLPALIADSSKIQYQKTLGYDLATSTPILSLVTTIDVQMAAGETANDIDDNGDGRIDEGFLTFQEGTGTPVRIAGNIMGLRFNKTTGGLSFAVDVGMTDREGNLLMRTYMQEVTFRN